MTMVQKNAYTQATAPDSMAVNIPDRMPARMITMVMSPQTASSAIFSPSRSGTTGRRETPACGCQRTRPIRQAPKSRPGKHARHEQRGD